jgi:hypothetical protein
MGFTVTRGPGGSQLTFHVRYDGAGVPSDLHVVLLDPEHPSIDKGKPLVGYDHIPEEDDPKKGIDIPASTGWAQFPHDATGQLATGIYTFALRWSFGIGTRPDEIDPDQPTIVQPPLNVYEPVGGTASPNAEKYYLVNIKVVLWIPYIPSDEMLPSLWYGSMSNQEEQLAGAMMSTGNPDPPDAFPTASDYQQFVASKEYRGIVDFDLLVCCPPTGSASVMYPATRDKGGFTPASQSVPMDQLHDKHIRTESMGSKILRRSMTAAGLPAPAPESFTPGNFRDKPGSASVVGTSCGDASPTIEVQVNTLENSGYWVLSFGYILPYMWINVPTLLCCGGTLTVKGIGSAIPSKKLYVNNEAVATYSMTSTGFDQLRPALQDPTGSVQAPADAGPAVALPGFQFNYTTTLPSRDGCPATFPQEWLFGQ